MSMSNDDNEVDKIYEDTNLAECKLIHLPLEQLGDLSQENTDIGTATKNTSRLVP